jgi:hypothetical protein
MTWFQSVTFVWLLRKCEKKNIILENLIMNQMVGSDHLVD